MYRGGNLIGNVNKIAIYNLVWQSNTMGVKKAEKGVLWGRIIRGRKLDLGGRTPLKLRRHCNRGKGPRKGGGR